MISIYFYNEIDIHVLAYEGLSTYKLYSNFSFYDICVYVIEATIMKSLTIQSLLVTTLILKKEIRMKMNHFFFWYNENESLKKVRDS